ncbi:MAG: hypothetical protein WDN07_02250 [Actinomycetota bacterium]
MSGASLALFISVFFACAVEAVEAVTIVLAVGTARDWRSAIRGVFAGLLTLAVIIAIFGPAISHLSLSVLRVVVGGLLLIFGLTWLRKAILRASGFKELHDEEKIFQAELEAARAAAKLTRHGVADWYAFTLSYKGVLLEGLEVVFIVLTFGTIAHKVTLASIAALIAIVIVCIVGSALRAPLAKVPENTLKFGVGVLITSYGIFWGAEGASGDSAHWPGDNWAVLAIIASVLIFSLIAVLILKVVHRKPRLTHDTKVSITKVKRTYSKLITVIRSFIDFWIDFIVGDDWRIAAGIVIAFIITTNIQISVWSWATIPVFVAIFLSYSLAREI